MDKIKAPKKPITKKKSKLDISTLHLVQMMNNQDQQIAINIGKKNKEIAQTIDLCVEALNNRGRVICVGTVTNGGLGILDVADMYPIYERKNWINSIIAEGNKFIRNSKDPKANDKEIVVRDLKFMKLSARDVIIAISSSGSTPYTIAAMKYAKTIKAKTIAITTTSNSTITKNADVVINPVLGVEIILNSTRMKSWSTYKFIINMISTGVMIKMDRPVRRKSTINKDKKIQLSKHSINVISKITSLTKNKSKLLLDKSGQDIQIAIVMHYIKVNKKNAMELLEYYNGSLRLLFEDQKNKLTPAQKRITKKALIKLEANNAILKINYVRILTNTKNIISKTKNAASIHGKKLQYTTEMKVKKLRTKIKNSLIKNKK